MTNPPTAPRPITEDTPQPLFPNTTSLRSSQIFHFTGSFALIAMLIAIASVFLVLVVSWSSCFRRIDMHLTVLIEANPDNDLELFARLPILLYNVRQLLARGLFCCSASAIANERYQVLVSGMELELKKMERVVFRAVVHLAFQLKAISTTLALMVSRDDPGKEIAFVLSELEGTVSNLEQAQTALVSSRGLASNLIATASEDELVQVTESFHIVREIFQPNNSWTSDSVQGAKTGPKPKFVDEIIVAANSINKWLTHVKSLAASIEGLKSELEGLHQLPELIRRKHETKIDSVRTKLLQISSIISTTAQDHSQEHLAPQPCIP
eukprot:c32937_g1_i1.p1 GENE.c32937_g1_i1~~c32937_g1_i1.p1  ORF type:complete len:349 (-),score=67.48 c32937_g1_i1:32-1003(-)